MSLSAAVPGLPAELAPVCDALGVACVRIARALRNRSTAAVKVDTTNAFGDEQLDIDLQTELVIFEELRRSGVVATAASEESPTEVELEEGQAAVEAGKKSYSVAFDPLDGSSIVDANFAVGTIFGVWPGAKLDGRSGREQELAVVAQYGPALTMFVGHSLGSSGQMHIAQHVDESDTFVLINENVKLAATGKIFAPGNLRAASSCPKYAKLVAHWMAETYQLRYTGGMVPDIVHIFCKKKGVFSTPGTDKHKAKLRFLYEVGPFAYLVECAGGRAVCAPDARFAADKPILDVVCDGMDMRLGCCYGSSEEVQKFVEYMK